MPEAERRLAAIVAMDVAGYSRLLREDGSEPDHTLGCKSGACYHDLGMRC